MWWKILVFILGLLAEGLSRDGAVMQATSVFGVSASEIRNRLS
jgi:hypothetical protein